MEEEPVAHKNDEANGRDKSYFSVKRQKQSPREAHPAARRRCARRNDYRITDMDKRIRNSGQ
jgi:hypothetical protein